jgi:hypothetical protein
MEFLPSALFYWAFLNIESLTTYSQGLFCPKLLQRADMPKTASCLNGSPRAVGRLASLINRRFFGAIEAPTLGSSRDVPLARHEPFDHQMGEQDETSPPKNPALGSRRCSAPGRLADRTSAKLSLAVGTHHRRLMPPAYVRPYVKRQKNDAMDAEAICEASSPTPTTSGFRRLPEPAC